MWHVWERREITYWILLLNLESIKLLHGKVKETGPLEDVGKVGE